MKAGSHVKSLDSPNEQIPLTLNIFGNSYELAERVGLVQLAMFYGEGTKWKLWAHI